MTAKKKRPTLVSPAPAKKAPPARQVRATPSASRSRTAHSTSAPEVGAEPTAFAEPAGQGHGQAQVIIGALAGGKSAIRGPRLVVRVRRQPMINGVPSSKSLA